MHYIDENILACDYGVGRSFLGKYNLNFDIH